MTPKPISRFRATLYTLLGMALSTLGLVYSIKTYPGFDGFTRLATALPALAAVASFAMAIVAALAGLLLLPMILRRRRPQVRQPADFPGTRSDYGVRPLPPCREPEFQNGSDLREADPVFGDFVAGTSDEYAGVFGNGPNAPRTANSNQPRRPARR